MNMNSGAENSAIVKRCISLLQTCATSKPKLKQIHGFSIRHGVSITDADIGKHFIFYLVSLASSSPPSTSPTRTMSYAHNIFLKLQSPNIFAWNTLIRGYAETNNPIPAVELYSNMRVSAFVKPDTYTYPFVLKVIAKLADVRLGEKVHSVVLRSGFESLIYVQNSLLYFYSSCGILESAHKVFELMPERDLVAWNSVINGFALNGRPNEALTLFREMTLEKTEPDGFTMVSLLSACAELGALALGRRIHVYVIKSGWTGNLHANNALLDFYSKCGRIAEGKKVFDAMDERNEVSWTSLIVGLAVNGFGKEAIELFEEMERETVNPSEITFVGVLYACSHCGMIDEGFRYFRRMKDEFAIVPRIEHYGCMVDLLGRAGLVTKAYEYVQNMPLKPNDVIWRTLLSACTVHGDLALGEYARAQLLNLKPNYSGDYVLLSNLYASERRWSDVQYIRRKMLCEGVRKLPGHSIVEVGNCVHKFLMGDKSHPQSEEIYAMLMEMTKKLRSKGYVPITSNVLVDIEEEEKENALSYHSEKIAIAYMLISTPPRTPITVVKNLRVCADCHLAIKLISEVYDREIVVRDRSRFHHFRGGFCSCLDYW